MNKYYYDEAGKLRGITHTTSAKDYDKWIKRMRRLYPNGRIEDGYAKPEREFISNH